VEPAPGDGAQDPFPRPHRPGPLRHSLSRQPPNPRIGPTPKLNCVFIFCLRSLFKPGKIHENPQNSRVFSSLSFSAFFFNRGPRPERRLAKLH